jgi:hypothetical protein
MTTGIGSWNVDLLTIGPMYPFPGLEWLWLVIGVAFWIIWHVVQGRMESRNYADDLRTLRENDNMSRALKGERILRPM